VTGSRELEAARSLVEAAASGDADALARIMAAYDGDMTRLCMAITGDPHTARDAVAAAWPIAWRKLGSLRDPDRLRPWLMSVAGNQAKQLLRSARRRETHERRVAPAPSSDPADRAGELDLAAALARLGPDDRRLIGMRYLAGLTSEEIAGGTGETAAAIRGRLARLLARLRTELSDD
jgi:RNA polymerase sigma-70 factor (ECF subfamily)